MNMTYRIFSSSIGKFLLFSSPEIQNEKKTLDKINVRESRSGNQEYIIQRHKQHWAQDTGRFQTRVKYIRICLFGKWKNFIYFFAK